jgi:signal transduction histidine kinase
VTVRRSFRSQLLIGSVLWTVGVLVVLSVLGVLFLAHNPRPHAVVLDWFITVPAAISLAAGVGCLVAGALQIGRSLSAVDQLRVTLAAVHQGAEPRVQGRYPAEVQPLVDELNALLTEREHRVQRAIAKAGDLAHGLKTPLAVLSRDADRAAAGGDAELAASMAAQVERMRRQIDYHLAHTRASAAGPAAGLRTVVAASVDGLLRTLRRLHADRLHAEQLQTDRPEDHRALVLEASVSDTHVVRCQREDLDEMLGNLLDNACKWARTRTHIASTATDGVVTIVVDDDGPGIEPSLVSAVLQRGGRADEHVPGSGLGLAIVHDLVELYGGSIEFARSELGGLRVTVRLPSAEARP